MGQDFLNGKTTNENLNQLMLTYSFAGNNSNYDSMVSTGVIEFIGDKSISREIVNYYETNYSMLYDMSEQLKKIYFEFTFYMKKIIQSIQCLTLLEKKAMKAGVI